MCARFARSSTLTFRGIPSFIIRWVGCRGPSFSQCTSRNNNNNVKHWSMLGAPLAASPLRLCAVPGYDGRCNDVVYCNPSHRAENQSTVIYFGGDMQDFTENMQSHRDSKNYLKWNLEDTARILHGNFADCHIIVIRPARIEYKTFSCFKNFVPCNNCGSPEHTPMHFALQHLERLLQNVSEKLRTMSAEDVDAAISLSKTSHIHDETETEAEQTPHVGSDEANLWWRENLHLDKNNLLVIGFSKGCVVLNQFLYEFHYLKTLTPDDHSSMSVVSRIKDMYWLDGGHSGGKNTWITSRPLLETLTRLGINVHIHVTPYQIQDDRRPCIRKEEKVFGDLLRRLGAPVTRTIHFENMFPNLYMHFDIINVFRLVNVHGSSTQCTEPASK
ncbi:PREDICTED: UPF0565 protein C2orf69 homolog isoform X2 [Nicrophorus vespilloides]|uniref:UPF0565 protein C2orf69 homolog isoform X2 n=1 Tax=Nicrophorus vespilloides TaxID=110193 RepID=A0ABM1MWY9_NICVS|nr:PREDICTED: UPF0565 protein C2orf69 homolog isoform X2 [Nicrophorus vespilloides]